MQYLGIESNSESTVKKGYHSTEKENMPESQ